MKKAVAFIITILFSLLVFSCKKEDSRSCVICSSPETSSFELCKENDGNASVNGQNTGTKYDVYVTGLEEAGVSCGN